MKWLRALRIFALTVAGVVVLFLIVAMLVYSPEYVYRVLVWQGSDAFDWQKFPSHPLTAAPVAYHFEAAPDPNVEKLFEQTLRRARLECFSGDQPIPGLYRDPERCRKVRELL